MKIKPLLALGIPLAAISTGALFFLLQPEPAGPEGPAGTNLDQPSTQEAGRAAGPASHEETPDLAETLRQKSADSEAERQKEIAAERQSGYVSPPLVLLEVDPSMGLNEAQMKIVEGLRRSFVEGLENLGKDPTSPEYLEHWSAERSRVDEALQLHLGDELFQKFSSMGKVAMDAARKAPAQ